jgi:hypothetical protein
MTQKVQKAIAAGVARWMDTVHRGDRTDPATWVPVAHQAACKVEFYDGGDERGILPEDKHRRRIFVNRRAAAEDQAGHIVYSITFWMSDTILRQASAVGQIRN